MIDSHFNDNVAIISMTKELYQWCGQSINDVAMKLMMMQMCCKCVGRSRYLCKNSRDYLKFLRHFNFYFSQLMAYLEDIFADEIDDKNGPLER